MRIASLLMFQLLFCPTDNLFVSGHSTKMACYEMCKNINLFSLQILRCFVPSALHVHQPLCSPGFLHGNCHQIIFSSRLGYSFPPASSPQHLVVAQILCFPSMRVLFRVLPWLFLGRTLSHIS